MKKHFTVISGGISLMTKDIWAHFHVMHLLALGVTAFVKCLFKSFVHFFTGFFVFLLVSFQEIFIYSGYNSLVTYMYCKYFLPVFGLPFYFLSWVVWLVDVLNFCAFGAFSGFSFVIVLLHLLSPLSFWDLLHIYQILPHRSLWLCSFCFNFFLFI